MGNIKIQKFIKISKKNADFASRSELETDKTKFSCPTLLVLGALMDGGCHLQSLEYSLRNSEKEIW